MGMMSTSTKKVKCADQVACKIVHKTIIIYNVIAFKVRVRPKIEDRQNEKNIKHCVLVNYCNSIKQSRKHIVGIYLFLQVE